MNMNLVKASKQITRALPPKVVDSVKECIYRHSEFKRESKKLAEIQFVPGRTYVNSVGHAMYQCGCIVLCNPEWDEYRVWTTANGSDGPTWCKMYIGLEEFQKLVYGLRYTDDPEETARIEKQYDEYCDRWKKRQHKMIWMYEELSKPINKKKRRYKNGKVRRF